MTLKATISTFIAQTGRWIASPSARNDEIYMPRERLPGTAEQRPLGHDLTPLKDNYARGWIVCFEIS